VPRAGIEPARLASGDFKSVAFSNKNNNLASNPFRYTPANGICKSLFCKHVVLICGTGKAR
ncbi:MAG: hypothetical protein K2X55_20850, partial [Burkholderiaceae bacterium]|nr:hypothetical protein [Burkholderiaceae bacterium]